MWKTVLRRILIMIPQLIVLSLLVFVLAKMMPGDPFSGQINPNQDPKTIAHHIFNMLLLLHLFGIVLLILSGYRLLLLSYLTLFRYR